MFAAAADFPSRGLDWRHEESIGLHRSAGSGVRRCQGSGFGAGRKAG
jgi:hypothetical protein